MYRPVKTAKLCATANRAQLVTSCTCAQEAQDWGWRLVDAIEYVHIATLYDCEYGFKQGRGTADSVFGLLQPPDPVFDRSSGKIDLSGEYVRVITGVLSPS